MLEDSSLEEVGAFWLGVTVGVLVALLAHMAFLLDVVVRNHAGSNV